MVRREDDGANSEIKCRAWSNWFLFDVAKIALDVELLVKICMPCLKRFQFRQKEFSELGQKS